MYSSLHIYEMVVSIGATVLLLEQHYRRRLSSFALKLEDTVHLLIDPSSVMYVPRIGGDWFAWFSQYSIGWSLPQCDWTLLMLDGLSLEKRLWGEAMPTNPIMREMHLILSYLAPYPWNWMASVSIVHRRLEEDAWLVNEDDDDHPAFLHDWIPKSNSAHRVYCSCAPMGLSWWWMWSWISRSGSYTPSRSCTTAGRWFRMSALPM